MKKTYQIEVDCANCANLMEEAAKKTEGVQDAVVNFMTQKMIVEFRPSVVEVPLMMERVSTPLMWNTGCKNAPVVSSGKESSEEQPDKSASIANRPTPRCSGRAFL